MRGPDFDRLVDAGFVPDEFVKPTSPEEIGQSVANILSDPTRLQQLTKKELDELQAASDQLYAEGGYHA